MSEIESLAPDFVQYLGGPIKWRMGCLCDTFDDWICVFRFTDAPEIEVERPFVHTGVGHEAQLICVVHAEPQAHVIWYKETTQIGTTEQLSQQVW